MRTFLLLVFTLLCSISAFSQPYILSKYAVEFKDADNKVKYRHQNDTVYNSIEALPLNTHIIFPKDEHINACSASTAIPTSKTIIRGGCFLLQNKMDETLVGAGSCQKILRKFTLIDWCYFFSPNDKINEKTYESASSWMDFGTGMTDPDGAGPIMKIEDWATFVPTPATKFPKSLKEHWVIAKRLYNTSKIGTKEIPYSYGYWEHTQIIKIGDAIAPTISKIEFATPTTHGETLCKDVEVCINDCNPQTFAFFAQATDDCIKDPNKFIWRWTIKLENGDLIQSDKAIFASSTPLPFGKHQVSLNVQDGCGNFSACSFALTVKNCKKPTPIAKTLLSTNIGDMGMAVIDASLINNSSYSCSQKPLIFRVQKVERQKNGFPKNPYTEAQKIKTTADALALPSALTLDCTDAACGFCFANFFVIGDNGSFDFVTINVDIWSNNPDVCKNVRCSGQQALSALPQATVTTPNNKKVEEFYVAINDNPIESAEAYQQTLTTLQENNERAVISISKTDAVLNGVSTADVIRLYQHLKGIKKFTSPYQYIAADVNRSGSVNYADYFELMQIVNKQKAIFDHAQTWVFVDKNQPLSIANIFKTPLQENITLNPNEQAFSFIGIKIGDIDGDVQTISNPVAAIHTNVTKMDNQSAQTLSVHPNPFDETAQIEFSIAQAEEVNMKVFDLNGRLLQEKSQFFEAGQNTFTLDSKNLHQGMYILSINTQNTGNQVIKIVKE